MVSPVGQMIDLAAASEGWYFSVRLLGEGTRPSDGR